MFQYVALAKDKQWQPGPYPGVELMILHKNEATGGVCVLRKFQAGITVPAHRHPKANEYAYVLSGEWEESGVVYTSGAFFFARDGGDLNVDEIFKVQMLQFAGRQPLVGLGGFTAKRGQCDQRKKQHAFHASPLSN